MDSPFYFKEKCFYKALPYLPFRVSIGVCAAGGTAGVVTTALLGFAGSHSMGGTIAGVR